MSFVVTFFQYKRPYSILLCQSIGLKILFGYLKNCFSWLDALRRERGAGGGRRSIQRAHVKKLIRESSLRQFE